MLAKRSERQNSGVRRAIARKVGRKRWLTAVVGGRKKARTYEEKNRMEGSAENRKSWFKS